MNIFCQKSTTNHAVFFSEQPQPKLTSNESSTVRGSYIGVSDESIWVQPLDHCRRCIWSNECVWSTLGHKWGVTLCVAAATLQSPKFLEMVWHDPTTFIVYALVLMGNNLAKVNKVVNY